MALEIVQKKSPLLRAPPPFAFAFAIEIDRERGDQIELASERGQRFVAPDRPDAPFDLKEIEQLRKKREHVDIETKSRVAQFLGNKKEEPASTTQIKDGLRRAAMQFQILGAADVEPQPSLHIRVFRVVLCRRGIPPLELG